MKQCKSCMSQIDAKATKCPRCGADQRNWFGRHKIITGILGFILVAIIIGAIGGSKSSTTSSSPSDTSTSTSNSNGNNNPTTQPTEAAKTAKVGDTVNEGDLAFTVQSVNTAQTIGNSFVQKKAQGMYYILAVKIQNNGKSTQTINASDFTVVDNQGRKYDYSTDGQTAMEETDGTTSLFLQQVQPGLGVNGKLVFDVPATATGLKLMAQGDIFSTPVSIDLGK